MAKRMSAEEKAVGAIVNALNVLAIDFNVFSTYLSMAPLIIKEKFLDLVSTFIEYEAVKWDKEQVSEFDGDYYRQCARMRDVLRLYR